MKKLLLILFISLGLNNPSFAGVKDISIICEDSSIFEDWKPKGYQGWLEGSISVIAGKKEPGKKYVSDLILVGNSSSSVLLEISSWIEHSNILNGEYKLVEEKLSYVWFEKHLKLGAKKGRATIYVPRDTGGIYFRYELDVDKTWKDFHITKYKASTVPGDCKEYKRLF
jgi:hypothetical protein